MLAKAGGNGVIMEAFKPGTAPPDRYSVIGFEGGAISNAIKKTVSPAAQRAVIGGTGGLY